jgi:hypothetical protein
MLTIPEEFLLLTVTDDAGGFVELPVQTFNSGFVGAAIMELALKNRIDSDLEKIWITDNAPTDAPCVNAILRLLQAADFDFRAEKLIEQLAASGTSVRDLAVQKLCERRILMKREGRILWVFKTQAYPMIDDKQIRDAKKRLLGVLLGDALPSPRDACLLALADASDLIRQIVPPGQMAQARARLETIGRMELLGQNVKHYISLWRAAMDQALAVAPPL